MNTVVLANLLGLAEMLRQPFMQHALLAGSAIAAAAGGAGYFLVIRGELFAGDALSHVAFTGAVAALAAGVDVRIGLFAAVVTVAGVLALAGGRGRADDVEIGALFAWVLGLGVLFLSWSATRAGTTTGVQVLFGSIFGFDAAGSAVAAAIATGALAALAVLGRPLLFASVDPAIAAAAGVPARAVGAAFLVVVATTAGVATQAVGALLLLALLAAPAAAARRITPRPGRAVALSIAFAVGSTWAGLVLAYRFDAVPASFAITAAATACYAASAIVPRARRSA